MAAGIAFSIVGKLAEYAVDPVLRQIKYLFFYNSNIQNLRDKVKDLENRQDDVKLQVDAAKRNVEIIFLQVSAWLGKVDELKENANEVLKGVASSEMRCLFNRCPNLKARYLLSRRATKKTIEANKLVEVKFEKVGFYPPPVQELNPSHHERFETRLSTKKKIKEALKDKDIGIIGICGMPGVGKTTMAKEIVNEVKSEKLFEEVAFAVVSNDADINKIQDQLAEALGLNFKEKTTSVRAGRLRQRLEDKDVKSILVILDDLWNEIDLGSIGIPSPHDRKGLKILFTTRIEKTCIKMGAKAKFKIEVLSIEEGWKLFKDTAGISETDADLVSIAKEVADECGGLPLALMVVGKALNDNKNVYAWKDARLKLQRPYPANLQEMDNTLYQSIILSYDYLGSEDRDLLLLCSLFAEDESIPIEYLVGYARGLELFKGTETLDETRDRSKKIMDNLKSCYLLQPGNNEDEVKLHDVIRDFCLQMSTTKGKYLVKHAGLTEWPEHDADESYIAISIRFDELGQLPDGLKYQKVKLLRVICRELEECIISEEFFKDMKELRVLELVGMHIQIPSAIQLLTGLRTLHLTYCQIHSQLSMTGSLKKLEILSFNKCFGDFSLIEFTNLCNLRSLMLPFDFSCPLLPGVFSGMKKLEDLNLGYKFPVKHKEFPVKHEEFPVEGEDAKILMNAVSELDGNGFINLKTLILSSGDFEYLIDATNTIPNGSFGKLESLQLHNLSKLREICNGNLPRVVFEPPLFCNLMTVVVCDCKAITSLFRESVAKCLVNLRSIVINNCRMLEDVISTDTREIEVTKACKMLEFPKLKEVNLQHLSRFKSFTRENEVTKACEMLEFPKLKEVHLQHLSRFKSFTSQSLFNQVNFPNMEKLFVFELPCIVNLIGMERPIPFLHKPISMWVGQCAQLQSIVESDSIQLLQNLDKLCVYQCIALEVLFDFEGIKVTNDDAEISVLGQLRELWLRSLPELVHITRMVPKGICVFQNLTKLTVEYCNGLRYLFLPTMANSLVALEDLEVSKCESIKAIFGIEDEDEDEDEDEEEEEGTSEIKNVEAIKTRIVFPKLDSLLLKNLSSIQMFCSQNYELVFPLLMDLTIENCPMMKKLSPWPVSAPKLSKQTKECLKFLGISDLLDESGGSPEEEQVCNK